MEQCDQDGSKFLPATASDEAVIWSCIDIEYFGIFISPLSNRNLFTPQAIDVLERTLDNGFDTSFEPKEYIRIYT